jgi:hypothetical protein
VSDELFVEAIKAATRKYAPGKFPSIDELGRFINDAAERLARRRQKTGAETPPDPEGVKILRRLAAEVEQRDCEKKKREAAEKLQQAGEHKQRLDRTEARRSCLRSKRNRCCTQSNEERKRRRSEVDPPAHDIFENQTPPRDSYSRRSSRAKHRHRARPRPAVRHPFPGKGAADRADRLALFSGRQGRCRAKGQREAQDAQGEAWAAPRRCMRR